MKPFKQTRVGKFLHSIFGGTAKHVQETIDKEKNLSTKERAVLAVDIFRKFVNDPRTNAWALETSWKGDDVALALFKEWLPRIAKVIGLTPDLKKDWKDAATEAGNAMRAMYTTPRGEKLAEMAARFELAQVAPQQVAASVHTATIAKATADTQEAYVQMKASGELTA